MQFEVNLASQGNFAVALLGCLGCIVYVFSDSQHNKQNDI